MMKECKHEYEYDIDEYLYRYCFKCKKNEMAEIHDYIKERFEEIWKWAEDSDRVLRTDDT